MHFSKVMPRARNTLGKKSLLFLFALSCLNFNVVICNLQRASCFVNISVGLIQNDNTNSQLHILVYRCVGLIAKYVANLREICWLLSSQDFLLVEIFFFNLTIHLHQQGNFIWKNHGYRGGLSKFYSLHIYIYLNESI